MPAGRGRGGRGGRPSGRAADASKKPAEEKPAEVAAAVEDPHHAFSIDDNSTQIQRLQSTILTINSPFTEHNMWYRDAQELYVSELLMLLHSVDVPRSSKINALLIGFENRDADLLQLLITDTTNFTLPEMLAAARALDSARRVRSLHAKIAAITAHPDVLKAIAEGRSESATADGEERRRPKRKRGVAPPTDSDAPVLARKTRRCLATLAKFKAELVIRQGEKVAGLTATLSGHNTHFFCRWAETLEEEELSHFLLEFGLDPWRELADLTHLNPGRMRLPCFLHYAHDPAKVTLPESLQFALKMKENALTRSLKSQIADVVRHKVPYGFLKKVFPVSGWDDATKAAVARYLSITTLLWWFEELRCAPVEAIINERLAAGEAPSFGYGKLMERLMVASRERSSVLASLVPVAQQSISEYSMPLRTPMAVLGDCSGSMQVAVRTSSIIVSLMAALGSAKLLFFNNKCVEPRFVPETIKEVLMVSEEVIADGPTAPAAALEQLYSRRLAMETLVVVSDEKENEPGPLFGLMFHDLLLKYRAEVAPTCTVVLVSFLGATEDGEMAAALGSVGVPFLQCRLNGARPDLTKLDLLLGKLSMDTPLHVVATKALSLIVQADKKRLRDAASYTFDFRRDSAKTVVRLVSTAVQCAVADRAADVVALVEEFLACLNSSSDFVAACRKRLAECGGSLPLLREWVTAEWGIGFQQHVESASGVSASGTGGGEVYVRQPYRVGTISRLPQEVLSHILGFVGRADIDNAERAAPSLARICHEARFDAKFFEKKGEFDDQLDLIRAMGLLEVFDASSVLATLKTTKGNVDHAVALLFGEGRRH